MIRYDDNIINYNNIVPRWVEYKSLLPQEPRPKRVGLESSVNFIVLDGLIVIQYSQVHTPEWKEGEENADLGDSLLRLEYAHVFTVNKVSTAEDGDAEPVLTPKAEILQFEEDLVDTLAGLVYSTMRGIIQELLIGTSEQAFVLPLRARDTLLSSSNWSALVRGEEV